MKVAVIGASGNAGSRICRELLDRGHKVTGIVRHPEKLGVQEGLTARQGDITDETGLITLIRGHDAVVSSVRFQSANISTLISAVKKAAVPRLLMVGGAGSLQVAPGRDLVDSPDFPAEYKAEASAGRDFLKVLKEEKELNWTFLSPSALFAPGKRTGSFRLGTDQLLIGPDSTSSISMEDFAIAMVDELESPRHPRQRFTVGY